MSAETSEILEESQSADAGVEESGVAIAPEGREPEGQHEGKHLGIVRWVQFAFMAIALCFFWVLDKVIAMVWDNFAEPKPVLVSLMAALGAGVITILLYKNALVNRIASETTLELSRVTWPSKEETYVSTMVVIVTSIIAAMILGGFDTLWSAITDLVYKV